MAIFHCAVKTISRVRGQSAVRAAAYRAGARLRCERTGTVADYSRRRGVVMTRILAPQSGTMDRERIWNAVEAAERRGNSTLAREIEIALPAELPAPEREALALRFATAMVERYGVMVDIAVHTPSDRGDNRNHHAHVLMSTRRVIGPGQFGAKVRILDSMQTGPAEIVAIRELWASLSNASLAAARRSERVDHRSYEARGIDAEPGRKLGVHALGFEHRTGAVSDRRRDVGEWNIELEIELASSIVRTDAVVEGTFRARAETDAQAASITQIDRGVAKAPRRDAAALANGVDSRSRSVNGPEQPGELKRRILQDLSKGARTLLRQFLTGRRQELSGATASAQGPPFAQPASEDQRHLGGVAPHLAAQLGSALAFGAALAKAVEMPLPPTAAPAYGDISTMGTEPSRYPTRFDPDAELESDARRHKKVMRDLGRETLARFAAERAVRDNRTGPSWLPARTMPTAKPGGAITFGRKSSRGSVLGPIKSFHRPPNARPFDVQSAQAVPNGRAADDRVGAAVAASRELHRRHRLTRERTALLARIAEMERDAFERIAAVPHADPAELDTTVTKGVTFNLQSLAASPTLVAFWVAWERDDAEADQVRRADKRAKERPSEASVVDAAPSLSPVPSAHQVAEELISVTPATLQRPAMKDAPVELVGRSDADRRRTIVADYALWVLSRSHIWSGSRGLYIGDVIGLDLRGVIDLAHDRCEQRFDHRNVRKLDQAQRKVLLATTLKSAEAIGFESLLAVRQRIRAELVEEEKRRMATAKASQKMEAHGRE